MKIQFSFAIDDVPTLVPDDAIQDFLQRRLHPSPTHLRLQMSVITEA